MFAHTQSLNSIMKKILLFWLPVLFLGSAALGQVQKGHADSALMPVLSPHYQDELTFDKSTNHDLWNSQHGFHASFGSEDALYFRAEAPELKETYFWLGAD